MYIGQTRSTIAKRFNQHCEKRNKTVISCAIRKHGKESFALELLLENITSQTVANSEEVRLIEEFKTLAPFGYNLERGGNNCSMDKATKKKISNALRGRKVTWGDKVSEGVKRLWEDPAYRDRQTKQRHEKRGKYRGGIVRLKLRKDIDIEEFIEDYHNFMGLSQICTKYDCSTNTIYQIIKRENIKKRGYKCNQIKG